MKTKLPKEHLVEKRKLDQIVAEILSVAKPRIAKIVLYGSYARGDWVRDHGEGYYSDFDIMIMVKKGKTNDHRNIEMKSRIEKRLEKLEKLSAVPFPVKIIIEPIKHVNQKLEKSQYFFSDVVKEGVLLYDSGEFEFAKARSLSWSERKEISQDYFEDWFPYGTDLLLDSIYNAKKRKNFRLGAFYLHQATESFYSAILLVFTAYKKKLHDIEELGKLAIQCSKKKELLSIFPHKTEEEKDRFQLLKDAYIKARYDKNYKITEEELSYLISRVEVLKEVTEKICLEWINQ